MLNSLHKKKFLIELITCAILVASLHHLALNMFLYWTIDWFDIPMHFLGGATMAFLALYIFFTSGIFPTIVKLKNQKIVVFLFLVFFTLVIGLIWELWEIFFVMSDVLSDRADTILDLIMDIVGAVFVYYYAFNKLNINE
jgi:hypothetical protein